MLYGQFKDHLACSYVSYNKGRLSYEVCIGPLCWIWKEKEVLKKCDKVEYNIKFLKSYGTYCVYFFEYVEKGSIISWLYKLSKCKLYASKKSN